MCIRDSVLFATIGFCILSTILFGLGPAWNLAGWNLFAGLKIGDRADFHATVSYTHLDVYKRQYKHNLRDLAQLWIGSERLCG